jgi:hypothetical protein
MELKTCSKCKEAKESFPKDKRSSDGLSSWCRSCHREATVKWRSENKEKVISYNKSYHRTDYARYLSCKKSAKRRGIEFNLTETDFYELISDECFYCDGFLGTIKGSAGHGLDRVNNDLGYHYDNLVPCCSLCNKLKNNFLSLEETLKAVEAIIKVREENV